MKFFFVIIDDFLTCHNFFLFVALLLLIFLPFSLFPFPFSFVFFFNSYSSSFCILFIFTSEYLPNFYLFLLFHLFLFSASYVLLLSYASSLILFRLRIVYLLLLFCSFVPPFSFLPLHFTFPSSLILLIFYIFYLFSFFPILKKKHIFCKEKEKIISGTSSCLILSLLLF